MEKGFLLLMGFLLFAGNLQPIIAQEKSSDDFIGQAVGYFGQLTTAPYEKLYLHLDKPYYSAGENIWFSGYLVDGVTTKLSPYSRYIYVELLNKNNSVVGRYKIKKDSLGLIGNLPIPSTLIPDDYCLRAYSWWMQNSGIDYFFQQVIHIGNKLDQPIQTSINYKRMSANQLNADIIFMSDNLKELKGQWINYKIYRGDQLVRARNATIRSDGHVQLGFEIDTIGNKPYKINLSFLDDSYTYKRTFSLPSFQSGFNVQFFPEGGNLLNNGQQNVAFKAVGTDGLSVEVEGTVFNQKGDTVTTFKSRCKGMGMFPMFMNDLAPEKYYAKVHLKGSFQELTFNLPPVKNEGVGLSLQQHNDRVFYQIRAANKREYVRQQFYLLVQQRGALQTVVPVNDSLQWAGVFNTAKFRTGIVHFLLLDEQGNALSERLIFVDRQQQSAVQITPDKAVYKIRSAVHLSMQLQNKLDTTTIGKFSIAVTEDATVKTDSVTNNIRSSLLLTSDLKGYIEAPGRYFNTTDGRVSPDIDLVMLTHGWTRFNVPSLLKGQLPKISYPLEQGQYISGKVTKALGGIAQEAQLAIVAPKIHYRNIATADANGRFVVDGLSFPDSSTFFVQALSKKGRLTVGIQMDSCRFPLSKWQWPALRTEMSSYWDDYMNMMSKNYYYQGGERMVLLREVKVSAKKKETTTDRDYFGVIGRPISSKDMEKYYQGMSALDILRRYGLEISGYNVTVRSCGVPTLFINGIRYYKHRNSDNDDTSELYYMLDSFTTDDMESINLFKRAEALFILDGGMAVISIITKNGYHIPDKPKPGFAFVRPLGYYEPAQFYSPKYETAVQINNPNPDLRTTLYWNPSVIVAQDAVVSLGFYTADRPGNYTVNVEGITSAGEPLVCKTKITVK